MSDPSTKPPGFTYHECPDCGFDAVTREDFNTYHCPICAEDCGRDVAMRSRPARDDDAVEGRDWRKEIVEAAGAAGEPSIAERIEVPDDR